MRPSILFMKYIYLLPVVFVILEGCSNDDMISDPQDYNKFLQEGVTEKKSAEIGKQIFFWQSRLQKDTGNYVDMLQLAVCYLKVFDLKGGVKYLNLADSFLKKSSEKLNHTNPEILFAISQNKISQHRFQDAAYYVHAAERAGADQYTTSLLRFDTEIEIGAMVSAKENLRSIRQQESFDCLIRRAKLEDHEGNAGMAIHLMEQAFLKVKNGKKELYCWALSNLADMYGHAGRIKDAYDAYLAVLERDNSYLHALKGIAWIAFSHDKNTTEAARIYKYILSEKKAPELLLVLAEMEEWRQNEELKKDYIQQFLREMKDPCYGNMYNKYLLSVYTDEMQDFERALRIAENETHERPTPETYDWLAWTYFARNETANALGIINNFVYKRNFEPTALWHMATIFASVGKTAKAKELLQECLKYSFELGPLKTKRIKEQFNKLLMLQR